MLTMGLLVVPVIPAVELSVNTSALLIGTIPPAGFGGPNPQVTYLVGASLPLPVAGIFFLEPMVELFGTYYEWVNAASVAVPALEEAGGSFLTLGTLVSLHGGAGFPLSSAVSLGGSLGLDVLLRFPIAQASDGPGSAAGQAAAPGYFFGAGRFIYPETRLFLRLKFSNALTLVLNVRAFYPVFHLWDGLGQPFLDQFMLSGGLGFAMRLGAVPPAASPAAR